MIAVGQILRVVRDSVDLGLDRGMRCQVVSTDGVVMDLMVAALDMTIVGVAVDHVDLEVVS